MDYKKELKNETFYKTYDFVDKSKLKPNEKVILCKLLSWRYSFADKDLKFASIVKGMNNSVAYRAKKGLIEKGFITEELQWTGRREVEEIENFEILKFPEELKKYADTIPELSLIDICGVDYYNDAVKIQSKIAIQNQKAGVIRR